MQKSWKILTSVTENGFKKLPEVIKALNAETKKAPPIVTRKVDTPICPYANVRYLYQPGELEGGKRRATDPIWSADIQGIRMYYLLAPKRGFIKEELLIVPADTVTSHL